MGVRDPSSQPAPLLDDETRRRGLRVAPALLLFPALFATLVPEWSPAWALVASSLLLCSLAFMLLTVLTDRYRSPKWRGVFGISQFDLFGFLTAVMVWRGLGSSPWLALVLGAILLATAAVGHRFRRAIMQELFEPTTRVGVIVAGLAMVGPGGAGALGYAFSQSVAAPVGFSFLFLGALLVVLASHAMWIRAEDPSWQPVRARRRRKPKKRAAKSAQAG